MGVLATSKVEKFLHSPFKSKQKSPKIPQQELPEHLENTSTVLIIWVVEPLTPNLGQSWKTAAILTLLTGSCDGFLLISEGKPWGILLFHKR